MEKKQAKNTPQNQFTTGIRDALPVVLGYLPLGVAFGVLARSYGVSTGQVAALSILMYSGSGQFIAIGLLKAGLAPLEIITSIFLVNLRYLLLSASIAPFFRKIPSSYLAAAAHGITDETYAVALGRFRSTKATLSYTAGLFTTAYLSWVSGTVLGAAVGNLVGDTARFGLDFALTAMFISLLVMQLNSRPALMAAAVSGFLSVMIREYLHSGWNVVAATVMAATLGVIFSRWKAKYL